MSRTASPCPGPSLRLRPARGPAWRRGMMGPVGHLSTLPLLGARAGGRGHFWECPLLRHPRSRSQSPLFPGQSPDSSPRDLLCLRPLSRPILTLMLEPQHRPQQRAGGRPGPRGPCGGEVRLTPDVTQLCLDPRLAPWCGCGGDRPPRWGRGCHPPLGTGGRLLGSAPHPVLSTPSRSQRGPSQEQTRDQGAHGGEGGDRGDAGTGGTAKGGKASVHREREQRDGATLSPRGFQDRPRGALSGRRVLCEDGVRMQTPGHRREGTRQSPRVRAGEEGRGGRGEGLGRGPVVSQLAREGNPGGLPGDCRPRPHREAPLQPPGTH